MSRDVIDELIAMRDRIQGRIEEAERLQDKLLLEIDAADASLAMADALALIAKGRFHHEHVAQVAAVKERLKQQIKRVAS